MDDERRDHHPEDHSPQADGRLEKAAPDGVLESLPRTRPQRVSPRRADSQARRAKRERAEKAEVKPRKAAAKRRSSQARPAAAPSTTGATAATTKKPRPRPPVPKQGYEPEEEIELGRTVHPPGPAELAESVAEIFLELASAGMKSTGRLIKDALSPLRRS